MAGVPSFFHLQPCMGIQRTTGIFEAMIDRKPFTGKYMNAYSRVGRERSTARVSTMKIGSKS